MPVFNVKGASGQAPTTVYFGPIPDRLTCLHPGTLVSGTKFGRQKDISANLLSLFVPQAASFGATTTAPDGSSNGKKLVEDGSTGFHVATAGMSSSTKFITYPMRVGVFAKAAERTRIAIYASSLSTANIGAGAGCKCVYDLAGGQIGVAPSQFNNDALQFVNYGNLSAEIVPFGNGWYRCLLSFTVGAQGSGFPLFFEVCLDAGAGTAAENTSYAGNGTNGVYGWKTTMLPPAAWALTDVSFVDDFTSGLSRIDVNNTHAPGFTYYIDPNTFAAPGFNGVFQVFPPSSLDTSVSSILHFIPPVNPPALQTLGMHTACGDGTSNGTSWTANKNIGDSPKGGGWHIPALFEFRMATDWVLPNSGANGLAVGTYPLELLTNANRVFGNESEWIEVLGGAALPPNDPVSSVTTDPDAGTSIQHNTFIGNTIWVSSITYAAPNTVFHSGQIYQAQNPNTNDPPPSANWAIFTPPNTQPTLANSGVVDPTVQNVYGTLWLPAVPPDYVGFHIQFFNGVMTAISGANSDLPGLVAYGPFDGIGHSPGLHAIVATGDSRSQDLKIEPKRDNPNIYLDSWKVTQ